MLSNIEYAKQNNVPETLSPLMDDFAAFTVVVPREGKCDVDLWRVRKLTRKNEKRIAKLTDDAQRAINLAKYIVRGWAFN